MKLYRVDDLLASYCEIGGYYIFAENLSDLGKILKGIRFDHDATEQNEVLQQKEIDKLQTIKESDMHEACMYCPYHRLDMKTITVAEFDIKPGLVDNYENGD